MSTIPDGLRAPLRFVPVYQSTVWGGRRMEAWRDDLPEGPIGESWDISDQARGVSTVAEGPLAGALLTELCREFPEALVGAGHPADGGFPLLIKLLDANDRLSVQVHPDDALARSFGVGARGKTECWYMIGDGGELFQGTAPGVDAAAFKQAIADNTVEACINRFETRDGDFFFMPARCVHALGCGCLLFEVQQSCDCTFRVSDWGRLGLDGKPRQLHVEESLQTIDFTAADHGPLAAPARPHAAGGSERQLADCAYFDVRERIAGRIAEPAAATCTVVCCISGRGSLACAGGVIKLQPMQSYLVPAAAGAWEARADSGDLRLLLTHPHIG
jgi:mannose-6-phosphate isomerase